ACGSAARVLRRALLAERRGALLRVRRGQQLCLTDDLAVEVGAQGRQRDLVDRPAGRSHRQRCARGEGGRDLLGALLRGRIRDELAGESPRERLLTVGAL